LRYSLLSAEAVHLDKAPISFLIGPPMGKRNLYLLAIRNKFFLMNSPPLSILIKRIGKGKSPKLVGLRPASPPDSGTGEEDIPSIPTSVSESRVQVASLDISATMDHQVGWKSSRVGSLTTAGMCGSESVASAVFRLASWRGHAGLVCAGNASLQSAVAALMESSCLRHSPEMWRCSCVSRASIKVGRNRIKRCPFP
jgi:hypothetical protein